jgi:hypothetical protein
MSIVTTSSVVDDEGDAEEAGATSADDIPPERMPYEQGKDTQIKAGVESREADPSAKIAWKKTSFQNEIFRFSELRRVNTLKQLIFYR